MHQRRVETHVDALALQVHVLIFHVRTAKEVGHTCASLVDEGVVGRELHRSVDAVFLLTVERVQTERVVDGFVVLPDGQLERVHIQGVRQQGCSNCCAVAELGDGIDYMRKGSGDRINCDRVVKTDSHCGCEGIAGNGKGIGGERVVGNDSHSICYRVAGNSKRVGQ